MKTKSTNTTHAPKQLARLAAVQALYRESYEQESLQAILKHMIEDGFTDILDESEKTEIAPDSGLFQDIVLGVAKHAQDIDGMLAGALDSKFSAPRMEIILRAILRAGIFELWHNPKTPKGAIISDYVDVARAYFQNKEPNLVNAVLDKLAAKLRPHEDKKPV